MTDQAERLRKAYERGLAEGKALIAGRATGGGIGRYCTDSARCHAELIGWPVEVLMEKVKAFHRERIDALPDLNVYPELRGARERLIERYRGMTDAGIDESTLAFCQTMSFWRSTRLYEETGKAYYAQPMPEKCRVVYVPDSDQGALHAKNIDDPLTYWEPYPPYAANPPWPNTGPLWFDGVGSGLHIDEIPPEIFPAEPLVLCREHCATVDEVEQFLVRYNYFWSHQNLLVHDNEGNSVAFEKTACRVATRGPNEKGINYITGMGALDPGIRAHQTAMRQKYLDQEGETWDGPNGAFWKISQGKWDNMTRYIAELSENPTFEGLKSLLEQRDPSGPMCCTGVKSHPDQPVGGCTLIIAIWLIAQKRLHRRQWRGDTPAYLDTPEIVQFV